jgi:hypothetical protein
MHHPTAAVRGGEPSTAHEKWPYSGVLVTEATDSGGDSSGGDSGDEKGRARKRSKARAGSFVERGRGGTPMSPTSSTTTSEGHTTSEGATHRPRKPTYVLQKVRAKQ